MPYPAPPCRHRGFTLVELIVVILILGILAAVGIVGYTQISDRAQAAAAAANLRQVATAVLAHHTAEQAPALTRALFLEALDETSVDVVDGLSGAATWTVFGRAYSPEAEGQFAVGFDTGAASAANDVGGTRAVVLTSSGDALYARVIVYGTATATSGDLSDGDNGTVPPGTTPEDVLSNPLLIIGDGSNPAGGGHPGGGTPGGGTPDGGGTPVATFGFALCGPEVPATGFAPVISAAGHYMLTTAGTVLTSSQSCAPDAPATVAGLTGVTQVAAAEAGADDATGWALQGDGDLYRINGQTPAATPVLTDIKRIITHHERATYALTDSGHLYYLQGGITQVEGASFVKSVDLGNYEQPRGFAVTTGGNVLFLMESQSAAVPMPTGGDATVQVAASGAGTDSGFALTASGDLWLIENASDLIFWPDTPSTTVSYVPGISNGTTIAAADYEETAYVTTESGALLLVAIDPATGPYALGTGLTGATSIVLPSASSTGWVIDGAKELFMVETAGIAKTSVAGEFVTPVDLEQVTRVAAMPGGGLVYAVHGTGQLTWVSGDGSTMGVLGADSGVSNVACADFGCVASGR